jgi:hypothetical protein
MITLAGQHPGVNGALRSSIPLLKAVARFVSDPRAEQDDRQQSSSARRANQ